MKAVLNKIFFKILIYESKLILKKYNPKVIAITGSVGKSSTKEAIYTALSRSLSVRKCVDGERAELTAALTLVGSPAPQANIYKWIEAVWEALVLILFPNHYPEWLIIVAGSDRPGDIEAMCSWLKLDAVVVTRFAGVPVHVEFFPSKEALFKDKSCLVQNLKKDGVLILNSDDEEVMAFADHTEIKPILFGKDKEAHVRIKDAKTLAPDDKDPMGMLFHIQVGDEVLEVPLRGTIGEHHGYHISAALALMQALGENVSKGAKSFLSHEPASGRMEILSGVNGSLIINDTYNSSPIAVEEALKTLKKLTKFKRKIAVLGDMFELGKFSIDEHRKMGELGAKNAHLLIFLGVRSRYAAQAAVDTGFDNENVLVFDTIEQAGMYLKSSLKKGDVVLVKGDKEMHMEEILTFITPN